MDIQAHVEEIEDSSSQEAVARSTVTSTTAAKKKSTNRKADGVPAPSNNNTLTRFLALGPHSRSAWEDVNRQCPVCQKRGFSTAQALAFHVNSCLDTGAGLQGWDGDEREAIGTTTTGAGAGSKRKGKVAGGVEVNDGRTRPPEIGPPPAARRPGRKHGTGGDARGSERDGASSNSADSTDRRDGRTAKERECEATRSAGAGAGKEGAGGQSKSSRIARSGK